MASEDEPAVQGRVEQVQDGVVEGWAWNPAAAAQRLQLRVLLDGQEVGATVADLPRPSLAAAGIGDGQHAFRFTLPATLASPGPHTLRIDARGEALPPAVGFAVDGNGQDPWHGAEFTVESPQPLGSDAPDPPAVDGRVEEVHNGIIEGWAWHPGAATQRVRLEVMLDGQAVGTAVAESPRESLAAAGIGDGQHAFRFVLPAGIARPGRHRLRIHCDGQVVPPSAGFTTSAERGDPWYAARFSIDVGDEPGAAAEEPHAALVGLDGWLFDSRAAQRWSEDDAVAAIESNVAWLIDVLDKLERPVADIGTKLLPVLCPAKEHVYRELLPREAREVLVQRPGELLARELLAHAVLDPLDLLPSLRIGAEQHPVFAPTTALLSDWGSYCAYWAIIKRVAAIVAGVPSPVGLDAASVRRVASTPWEGRTVVATDTGLVDCPPDTLPEPAHTPLVAPPAGATQRTPHEHLARIDSEFAAGWEQPDRDELARALLVGSPAHEAIAEWLGRHFRFTVIVGGDAALVDVVSLERPDIVVYMIDESALLTDAPV
jgi:hypothetical protein